ncbi:DeoR/GlpR family DNA-binding transcription regulator [Streptomyces antibioticus]|uniref:DeoR/GlpR family DNA-binding transcription regulator n=1 Tax=Streptomyces antibioticus TaxID=1890 RepID=UPI0036DC52B5
MERRSTRRLTTVQLDRHARTLELVEERGTVAIDELAEKFGISAMTVHRDLDVLERLGLLRKIRGGAVRNDVGQVRAFTLGGEASWNERARAALREKQAIAARAAVRIRRDMTVFVDDSTSCLPLVPYLARVPGITVVTNSLSLTRVAGAAGIGIVMVGGTYRAELDANAGPLAHDATSRLRSDIVFMSSPAVHEGGCYHPDQDSILVKRAAIAGARERILLADSSKFTRVAPYAFAALDDFDLVVTDSGTPAGACQKHLPVHKVAVVDVPKGDSREDG